MVIVLERSMRVLTITVILSMATLLNCSPFYAAILGSGSESSEENALLFTLLGPGGVNSGDSPEVPLVPSDYLVYLTTSQPDGDMRFGGEPTCDYTSSNPIERADCYCMLDSNNPSPITSTFKAMIVGGTRIATDDADCGAGCTNQADWVLEPYGNYKDEGGTTIFVTSSTPIFDPNNGLELQNSIRYGMASAEFWTGIDSDWTGSSDNCTSWNKGGPGSGQTGRSTSLNGQFLAHASNRPCDNNGGPGGSKVSRLLCVEVPNP